MDKEPKHRLVMFATMAVAFLAILLPIGAALVIARREGTNAETSRILSYAQDVLRRSTLTTEQILGGLAALEVYEADPCGPLALAEMRRIDVSSSYIQAVGHAPKGRALCSSLGVSFDLGPVDLGQTGSARLRTDIDLPFAPDAKLVAVQRGSFFTIVHQDHPIDTALDQADVSLATFSLRTGAVVTARGPIDPQWIAALGDQQVMTFIEDGYVVAVVAASSYRIGAVAAAPVRYLDERVASVALVVVPIGILAGTALALAVVLIVRQQRALPNVIRAALRHNEFYLEYQPIVDLQTGAWVGAEALIRWKRRNGEVIRPDHFIPVAEEAGLIHRITERVIALAGRDAVGLFALYPEFHLGLNLSPTDLYDPATPGLLDRLAEATGAGKKNLLVEVTERGFTDPKRAGPVIHALRRNGICVAIDDFGTGYSSLASLEALELDFLKIDKSFVDTLDKGAATSSVVLHIIDMAHSLHLEMIAEGIETADQAKRLAELGVPLGQGWQFARPMPIDELRLGLTQYGQRAKAS